MDILQNYNKPNVLIFAQPSGLALSLIEQLLNNSCDVVVLTTDTEGWNKKSSNLYDKSFLKIIDLNTAATESISGSYIVYINSHLEHPEVLSDNDEVLLINSTFTFSKRLKATTLFVFPYAMYSGVSIDILSYVEKFVYQNSETAGLLFLGDLIGTNLNFSETQVLSRIIKDIARGGDVRLPYGEEIDLYPINIPEAAHLIIKRLFSFGGLGEKVALLPAGYKVKSVADLLTQINPSLVITYINDTNARKFYENLSRKEFIETDFKDALSNAVSWYTPRVYTHPVITEPAPIENIIVPKIVIKEPSPKRFSKLSFNKFRKLKTPSINKKKLAASLSLLFFVVVSPFAVLFLGGLGMLLTKHQVMAGDLNSAKSVNATTRSLIRISYKEFKYLSQIPGIGSIYGGGENVSQVAYSATSLIDKGLGIAQKSSSLMSKILGGDGEDVSEYSRGVSLELGAIYNELSFLESDLAGKGGILGYFNSKLTDGTSIKSVRDKVLYLDSIVKEAPELLGVNKKKVYLVLLQNNMELRPTGGFIGSFALVTFDNGKLIDISVQDVYDADGQLVGHVEPPSAIKNYLGEAGWYLRDSNWDPDFVVSAQAAEWFLDKEIDTVVDGVIGVDLEFAKDLIRTLGPIELKDFGKTVSSENLYEITQSEVEEDFFPGSRKKSSFLTGLTSELLSKVTNIGKADYLKVGKSVITNLDNRHIQIFLHSARAQRAVAGLSWDGSVVVPECAGNCYSDFVGVIDANVGVNKANYNLSRRMNLSVDEEEGTFKHALSVDLQNSGSQSYKTYLRVLAPENSEFLSAEIVDAGVSKRAMVETTTLRGISEGGIFLEVRPNKNLNVIFRWESSNQLSFDTSGSYQLLWRKQAGTVSDPVTLSIVGPSLTNGIVKSYNTTLTKDFKTSLNW